MSDQNQTDFSTRAIRTEIPPSKHREQSSALYLNSGYRFDDSEHSRQLFAEERVDHVYSRYTNPNVLEFVQKMCALEKMDQGFATSTGMSAIFLSLVSLLNAGDHVVACRSLFGSSHQLFTQVLPRFQISHTYVDANKPETWEKEIKKETKMLFFETPSNPGLDLIDLEWAINLGHKHNLWVNIDNTFASPVIQNPGVLGADVVTHSATKFIDGQGRAMGGIALFKNKDASKFVFTARHTGPVISPFNAWLFSKSLETLDLRVEKHSQNALQLATFLEAHKEEVLWVKYPHLPSHPQYTIAKKQMRLGGGIVTFALKGGMSRAKKFVDSLKMLNITANLGDTRSLITHPALTTHSRLTPEDRLKVNITDDLLRVSVGLENLADVQQDITQAMHASKG